MKSVTNCSACGVRLTFEGPGPSNCPKCGAALGTKPPAPQRVVPPPVPPAEPIVAELVEEPPERSGAREPSADPALREFAHGCARLRAGTLFEAIGLAVAVTYLAALRFAPVELLAVADGFGKLSPVLLLLPAVPLAIGHLLGAFGRAVTLDACRDVGAGPPATVALVLACCRVVLAAVALLSFAALLLSVAFGAGANDRAAQAAEDAHFTRGVAALTFAYMVGLLIEATVLPALATVAAVRKWHEVGRRATGATLALQFFVIASLVAFALTLLPESEPVRAPRGRFEPKPVPLAEALAFAVQAVALGWYLAQQYALSAAGCRVSNGRGQRDA